MAVAGAVDLPDLLAGRLVEGDHPVAAGVDERQVEAVLVQQRRDVHAVLDAELAVALLDVEVPDLLAVEVVAAQVAGADEGVDVLAVGAGRGRGVVALVVRDAWRRLAELRLPQLLAVGADAQQHEVVAVLAGEEDAVAPDDGRGRRPCPGSGSFQATFLSRLQVGGQALLLEMPSLLRAAPLRPVVGECDARRGGEEQRGEEADGSKVFHGVGPSIRWDQAGERMRTRSAQCNICRPALATTQVAPLRNISERNGPPGP